MSNAGKAQNILQHEAKPIVKFIVPSPLEPLTTAVRRKKKNYLPPVARSAQRKAQTPIKVNQERYRTAGRVLQERADRRVLAYATGGSNAARRAPAKRDRSVHKKNSGIVLLSHSQIYSTIAAGALNHRVRKGNVCFCSAIDTGIYIPKSKFFLAPNIKKLKSVRIDLSCKKNSRHRATLP